MSFPFRAKALYDYTGDEGQLSLTTGLEMTILKEEGQGWALARLDDGKEGFVPIAYVEKVSSQTPAVAAPAAPAPQSPSAPTSTSQGDNSDNDAQTETLASDEASGDKIHGVSSANSSSEDTLVERPADEEGVAGASSASAGTSSLRRGSSVPKLFAEARPNDKRLSEWAEVSTRFSKGIGDIEVLISWIHKRAQIARSVGRDIAGHAAGMELQNKGTLQDMVKRMQNFAIETGTSSSQAADAFDTIAQPLGEQTRKFRDLLAKMNSEVSNTKSAHVNSITAHNQALVTYRRSAMELDKDITEQNHAVAGQSIEYGDVVKKAEKNIGKYVAVSKDKEKYQHTLDTLVDMERQFEADLKAKLLSLYEMERERIQMIMAAIQQYTALEQSLSSENAGKTNSLVASLDSVNEEEDHTQFIGTVNVDRPAPEKTPYQAAVVQGVEWDLFTPINDPERIGVAEKKGTRFPYTWKTRFFVLKDSFLYYFKMPSSGAQPTNPKEVLAKGELAGVWCLKNSTIRVESSSKPCIFITPPEDSPEKKETQLRFVTNEEQASWAEALQTAVRS